MVFIIQQVNKKGYCTHEYTPNCEKVNLLGIEDNIELEKIIEKIYC